MLIWSILGLLALGADLLPFSAAYTIAVESSTNALLAPGQTLEYNITVESGDTIVLVDILFVNGNLGNTTDIALNSDLTKQTERNGLFLIPFVPAGKLYSVRLVNTLTKELLKDSTTFEVFAPGSTSITSAATTLPPTSLPGSSKTSTSGSGSPTGLAGDTSNNGSSKSTNTGAIVGGVIGGVVVLGLLVALLWYKRRRNSSIKDDHKYEIGGHVPTLPPTDAPKEEAQAGIVAVTPFPVGLPTLNGSSMFSKANNSFDVTSSVSRSPGEGASGDNFANYGSPNSIDANTRAEALRMERERITREIAALESRSRTTLPVGTVHGSNTSGSISYAASSFTMPPSTATSGNSDLRDQIAVLQEQIRQIEARQGYVNGEYGTEPPPPEYEGPPSSLTENASSSPHDTSNPAPLVDIKALIA